MADTSGEADWVLVFEFNITLWVEDGKLTAVEEIFFVPRSVGADVYVATMTSNPAERNCRHPSYQLSPVRDQL